MPRFIPISKEETGSSIHAPRNAVLGVLLPYRYISVVCVNIFCSDSVAFSVVFNGIFSCSEVLKIIRANVLVSFLYSFANCFYT